MQIPVRFAISRTSGDGVPAGTLTLRLVHDRTNREVAHADLDYGQLGAVVTGGEALVTLEVPDDIDWEHIGQRLETLRVDVPNEVVQYHDQLAKERIHVWCASDDGYGALPEDWRKSQHSYKIKGPFPVPGGYGYAVEYARWVTV